MKKPISGQASKDLPSGILPVHTPCNTALNKHGALWLLNFPSVSLRGRGRGSGILFFFATLPSKKELHHSFHFWSSGFPTFATVISFKSLQCFSKHLFFHFVAWCIYNSNEFPYSLTVFDLDATLSKCRHLLYEITLDIKDAAWTHTWNRSHALGRGFRHHLCLWVCSLVGAAALVTHSWKQIYMAND